MKRMNTYKGIKFNVYNTPFEGTKYRVERYFKNVNCWHETFIRGNTISECVEQMKDYIDFEIELDKKLLTSSTTM